MPRLSPATSAREAFCRILSTIISYSLRRSWNIVLKSQSQILGCKFKLLSSDLPIDLHKSINTGKLEEKSVKQLLMAFNKISAAVLGLAVGSATVAVAQGYGRSTSPTFEPKALARGAPDAPITPFMIWSNANAGTGGVALRNRRREH